MLIVFMVKAIVASGNHSTTSLKVNSCCKLLFYPKYSPNSPFIVSAARPLQILEH